MRLELVTAPDVEPVTLTEAKAHCRVDASAEDAIITSLIPAARLFIEKYAAIALVNQTWRAYFDLKSAAALYTYVSLPLGTIQSITSIKTYDTDNAATTFDSSNYYLSGNRIVLNDNCDWPTFRRVYDTLEITFVAGFGSASDVPQPIKQALLMLVAHWYENREAVSDPINQQGVLMPIGVIACLQPYRILPL